MKAELTPQVLAMYPFAQVLVNGKQHTLLGVMFDPTEMIWIDKSAGLRDSYYIKDGGIQLVLRRLSSMSEEEGDYIEVPGYYKKEFVKAHNQREAAFTPDQFQYLLSRGFDLFGLIDAGLAVEPVPFQGDTNK